MFQEIGYHGIPACLVDDGIAFASFVPREHPPLLPDPGTGYQRVRSAQEFMINDMGPSSVIISDNSIGDRASATNAVVRAP
jgi:hypothetical protein